jgi:hypothetical protein
MKLLVNLTNLKLDREADGDEDLWGKNDGHHRRTPIDDTLQLLADEQREEADGELGWRRGGCAMEQTGKAHAGHLAVKVTDLRSSSYTSDADRTATGAKMLGDIQELETEASTGVTKKTWSRARRIRSFRRW